tara:strand:- start:216 stop:629 length:414 start_codon:yes stop_codon:yes gene_type:complete
MEGGLPTHLKNPFIKSVDLYRVRDVFERLTLNDLYIIPLNYIALRNPKTYPIHKTRILGADIRYPPIIYKAKLDPMASSVEQEYCVLDGTHRIVKMRLEGIKGAACFIATPQHFDGLKPYLNKTRLFRSTGCNQCEE